MPPKGAYVICNENSFTNLFHFAILYLTKEKQMATLRLEVMAEDLKLDDGLGGVVVLNGHYYYDYFAAHRIAKLVGDGWRLPTHAEMCSSNMPDFQYDVGLGFLEGGKLYNVEWGCTDYWTDCSSETHYTSVTRSPRCRGQGSGFVRDLTEGGDNSKISVRLVRDI
jgi:hypothetical protein